MGSRFALVAATHVLILVAAAGVAGADPARAKELFSQGIDAYRAQQYDAAAELLKQSYELDPKPDALFAWAQSERLAGHCDKAVPLYRKLTDESSDLGTAKLVHDNLARCEQVMPKDLDPKPVDATQAKPVAALAPPPQVVVHEVRKSDGLATAMFVGGSLSLGLGTGLFIASVNSASDADHAQTYDDHVAFSDRARLERTLSYIAVGAGAGMLGVAIFRVMGHSDSPPETAISVAPTSGGAAVTLGRRW